MNTHTAKAICKLPIKEGVATLLKHGAIEDVEDGQHFYEIDMFVFFRAFSDSKTLYWEN